MPAEKKEPYLKTTHPIRTPNILHIELTLHWNNQGPEHSSDHRASVKEKITLSVNGAIYDRRILLVLLNISQKHMNPLLGKIPTYTYAMSSSSQNYLGKNEDRTLCQYEDPIRNCTSIQENVRELWHRRPKPPQIYEWRKRRDFQFFAPYTLLPIAKS